MIIKHLESFWKVFQKSLPFSAQSVFCENLWENSGFAVRLRRTRPSLLWAVSEPVQIFGRQNTEFRVSWTKWIFCQAFCKFAKSRRPTWIARVYKKERRKKDEMESDNEGIEKTRPRACPRRFLQTGFAINQFKLAELDDTLVVLLEIHRRTVVFCFY